MFYNSSDSPVHLTHLTFSGQWDYRVHHTVWAMFHQGVPLSLWGSMGHFTGWVWSSPGQVPSGWLSGIPAQHASSCFKRCASDVIHTFFFFFFFFFFFPAESPSMRTSMMSETTQFLETCLVYLDIHKSFPQLETFAAPENTLSKAEGRSLQPSIWSLMMQQGSSLELEPKPQLIQAGKLLQRLPRWSLLASVQETLVKVYLCLRALALSFQVPENLFRH